MVVFQHKVAQSHWMKRGRHALIQINRICSRTDGRNVLFAAIAPQRRDGIDMRQSASARNRAGSPHHLEGDRPVTDINVDEALWAAAMLPEGILERWFVADGDIVAAGQRIAELRIEEALHDIIAPVSGRLSIVAPLNAIVEPGSVVATVA
jgi:hypothetical protein